MLLAKRQNVRETSIKGVIKALQKATGNCIYALHMLVLASFKIL